MVFRGMECHPYLSLSQKCSEELICNKKTVGSTPHDDTCVRGSLWRLPSSECGGWSIQSLKAEFPPGDGSLVQPGSLIGSPPPAFKQLKKTH